MDSSQIVSLIIDKLEFIFGLVIGLIGSIYSWHKMQIELKSKLYYPLFIACYNLLLIFDEIKTLKTNEEQGKELYNSAVKYLDDIMNSYGTVVNLKSRSRNPENNYLNMFFKVKRIVDLNQNSIDNNWPKATIWFENGKERKYIGEDHLMLKKIDEFDSLYKNLLKLKVLCENKDSILKVQTI